MNFTHALGGNLNWSGDCRNKIGEMNYKCARILEKNVPQGKKSPPQEKKSPKKSPLIDWAISGL
jgi:hypothetical protein